MPDICLDVPLAYTVLERFVERCQKGGFLTDEVIKKMPSRFVEETKDVGWYTINASLKILSCPNENGKLFIYFLFLLKSKSHSEENGKFFRFPSLMHCDADLTKLAESL